MRNSRAENVYDVPGFRCLYIGALVSAEQVKNEGKGGECVCVYFGSHTIIE